MTDHIQTGGQQRIIVMPVDAAGAPVGSLLVRCTILKPDGTWFKGSNRTWVVALTENAMVESPQRAGQYEFVFWPQDGDYHCSVHAYVFGGTGAASVINGPWLGDIIVGGWLDYIDGSIVESGGSEEVLERIGNTIISDELRRQRGILDQILTRVAIR